MSLNILFSRMGKCQCQHTCSKAYVIDINARNICIFMYVHMKSSFPKRVKRHFKRKWACNANAKFDYYLFEHSYSYMNKCVDIYEEVFSKT